MRIHFGLELLSSHSEELGELSSLAEHYRASTAAANTPAKRIQLRGCETVLDIQSCYTSFSGIGKA